MPSKIIDVDELKKYKTFVLGYGHFTTIHPGHIRYLKYAKSLGSELIIAIKGDIINGKKESIYQFNQKERAEALSMLDIADAIVLLKDDNLFDLIKITTPHALILGKQFEREPEKEVSEAIKFFNKKGKSVYFHGGEITYSNAELLSNFEYEIKNKRFEAFRSACKRQLLKKKDLLNSIDFWGKANLIVIGDCIVDRYVACEALGMSAEAPVVVVKELERKDFYGGASIVASHIKNLGANCKLISVIGDDSCGQFIKAKINEEEIKDGLIIDKTRPTTFKKRYMVDNQKLFRVTRMEQTSISKDIEKKIIEELEKSACNANGIVISDFVYGVITENILKKIYKLAKSHNLLLFGDLQCSSQVGSITKFKKFSLLCPNEREARIALHEKDLDLESLSNKIMNDTHSERLIMKLGPDGFIAYDHNEDKKISQAFPALSSNPIDVTGAGDSLLAVMSVGLSSSQNMMTTAAIGCCIASMSVERMGNKPIKREEIKNYINEKLIDLTF